MTPTLHLRPWTAGPVKPHWLMASWMWLGYLVLMGLTMRAGTLGTAFEALFLAALSSVPPLFVWMLFDYGFALNVAEKRVLLRLRFLVFTITQQRGVVTGITVRPRKQFLGWFGPVQYMVALLTERGTMRLSGAAGRGFPTADEAKERARALSNEVGVPLAED